MPVTTSRISQVQLVVIPVSDQERAVAFYEKLGFERRNDSPGGDGYRWVEVYPPNSSTGLVLIPPRPGETTGVQTGIILNTDDIDAAHAELRNRKGRLADLAPNERVHVCTLSPLDAGRAERPASRRTGARSSRRSQPGKGIKAAPCSSHATCRDEKRQAVDLEVALEIAAEKLEPAILRRIGELFAFLRARERETTDILQVVHHLVHQD